MSDKIELQISAGHILEPGDRVLIRVTDKVWDHDEVVKAAERLREQFPDVSFTFVTNVDSIEVQPAASPRTFELIALGAQISADHVWDMTRQKCRCGWPQSAMIARDKVRHAHSRHVADRVYAAVAAWDRAKRTQNDGGRE